MPADQAQSTGMYGVLAAAESLDVFATPRREGLLSVSRGLAGESVLSHSLTGSRNGTGVFASSGFLTGRF